MQGILVLANRILASIGTILILLQMILICCDIGGRFFFDHPIPGVFEIIELTIVAIVFLQIPNAIGTGNFIRSDAIFTAIVSSRPGLGRIMDIAFSLVGVLVMCAIAYGVWFKLIQAFERNLFTGNPGIFTAPIWPALLCIVIGSVFAALNYLSQVLRVLADGSVLAGESSVDGH